MIVSVTKNVNYRLQSSRYPEQQIGYIMSVLYIKVQRLVALHMPPTPIYEYQYRPSFSYMSTSRSIHTINKDACYYVCGK